MRPGKAFSVVICTRGREEALERCLAGLSRQTYPGFDILVVDSAPRDDAALSVARRWGAAYAMESQPGVSRARNLGVRASAGEIIALLDDDAVPDPDWLRYLAAEFEDPQVAAVAGRIKELRMPGEAPNAVGEVYSLDCLGDRKRPVDQANPQWFEITNFGGVGQGSNMAFRRSALPASGFDHRLGRGARIGGGEENYAFFRLVQLGYRVVYTPQALVYHPYPPNTRALRQHHLRHLAASTGYLTFLFFEEPMHRGRLVRFVLEALLGVPRTWRGAMPPGSARLVSRPRSLASLLAGPALYLRTRWGNAPPVGVQATPIPDRALL